MGLYQQIKIRHGEEGARFGKWTQVGPSFRATISGTRGWWCVCQCDCGAIAILYARRLRRGESSQCQSCKMRHNASTHGLSKTPVYQIWRSMKRRCHDEKDKRYDRYGGRGIRVCDRWRNSFEQFLADIDPRPSRKHELDRIDNDGNYEPGNVRWVTRTENARNRSNNRMVEYLGERMPLSVLCERCGVARDTIRDRLNRGWSVDDAVLPAYAKREKTTSD